MSENKQINIQNYNEDSIDDLSQIEGVRLRPQSIGFENNCHIYVEQLANCIDEAKEGFGNEIITTKHEDSSISVRDFGRSIPLDYNNKTKKYNWDTIFTKMWGGGKFSNNSNQANYKNSLGTNGSGNFGSATTTKFFEVWSYKGEECHNIRFEEGKVKKQFNKFVDNSPRGTLTHFIPDIKCYGDEIIPDEFIEAMLKQQSIVNGGIKFIYNNKGQIKEFYYENGIVDYIKEISQDKNFTEIYKFEGKTEVQSNPQDFEAVYDIYFTFNNSIKLMEYYHNSSYLPNGGLPEKVIKNAMTNVVDKYIKDNNLYKKGEKIKFEDISDSLIIVFSSGSTTSIFTDQTKKSIGHEKLQAIITDEFKNYLNIIFTENRLETEKIIHQILINMRARCKAEDTKLDIKKKLQEGKNSIFRRVEGLTDCDNDTDFEEKEIWICEGLSACSILTISRDDRTMATYPLKGRFINPLKSTVKKVLNNVPALGLIKALGCGIELPPEERKKYKDLNIFNIDNLRYSKIIICTDADNFGWGIVLALKAFFYKFMPTLLKQNRIYIAISPRYQIPYVDKDGKEKILFAYNEKEKEKLIKDYNINTNIYRPSIVKGLGQLNKDVFWNYVMNPENRILLQIQYNAMTPEEEKEIEKYFEIFVGEDIKGRKQYVKKNITKININEIE